MALLDVGALIDARPWSARGKLVLALVSLAIVFDGLDNQVLGLAAPAILREWQVGKPALGPVLALGQVGMLAGLVGLGSLGDRVGRKPVLVASVLLFGVATLAMAAAGSMAALGALRVVAGIGIGGALPNAAALVSEYTPARRRSLAVAASIVCVPLGGVVGGALAAEVLPRAGWRTLFAVAGCLPIAVALALTVALPESARFLLARQGDGAAVRRALARGGVSVPPGLPIQDPAAFAGSDRAPWTAIIVAGRRRDTLGLWIAFAGSSVAVYTGFGWLPTMLADAGFGLAAASTGLSAFNLGGVVGALAAAAVIGIAGSRRTMLTGSVAGVVVAALLAAVTLDPNRVPLTIGAMALLGVAVNATQTTLYALAAHVYPVALRSTGVGAAAGAGRAGAIASSFLGAVALAALASGGFFLLMAAAMAVATAGLVLVRRHVPPQAGDQEIR